MLCLAVTQTPTLLIGRPLRRQEAPGGRDPSGGGSEAHAGEEPVLLLLTNVAFHVFSGCVCACADVL